MLIFLYFVDHGIAGAIVFPDNKFLYADELEETFKFMKDMAEVLNHETASKAFADIYDDRVVDKDRFDDLR